ncbi:hypothetical protein J6590_038137 [Homalodisca vitripennis]|nr:hypothetical protein J6590_038137 [Homalodisca vitripennis]
MSHERNVELRSSWSVLAECRVETGFWFRSGLYVRQTARLDIERHRLYAGSTVSFADCEEYAHLTSLRHDWNGSGVTGLRSDCDTITAVDFVDGCGTRSPVECLHTS